MKRTRTTDTEELRDGRQRATIGLRARNVYTPYGWLPIDTDLEDDGAGNARAKRVPFAARFARNSAQPLVFGEATFRLEGLLPRVANIAENQATYSEVYTNTDLVRRVTPEGVHQELLLKGAGHPTTFTERIETHLDCSLDRGGNLQFGGFFAPRPYVEEGSPRVTVPRRFGSYVLRTEGGQKYVDLVLPDLTGMAYPLRVDPTLILQPNPTDGMDTQLWGGGPSFNYGALDHVRTGRIEDGTYHGLLKFDLTAIPPGSRILEVTLSLYNEDDTYTTANFTLLINALLSGNSGWVEGTASGASEMGSPCWSHKAYDTATWAGSAGASTSGIDFSAALLGSAPVVDGVAGWLDISLQDSTVQQWVNSSTTNYGMVLRGDDEVTVGKGVRLTSSDSTTASQRPKMTVEYALRGEAAWPKAWPGGYRLVRRWLR